MKRLERRHQPLPSSHSTVDSWDFTPTISISRSHTPSSQLQPQSHLHPPSHLHSSPLHADVEDEDDGVFIMEDIDDVGTSNGVHASGHNHDATTRPDIKRAYSSSSTNSSDSTSSAASGSTSSTSSSNEDSSSPPYTPQVSRSALIVNNNNRNLPLRYPVVEVAAGSPPLMSAHPSRPSGRTGSMSYGAGVGVGAVRPKLMPSSTEPKLMGMGG